MESKLARRLEQELTAAELGLTAEQRLKAFLAHSRLMMELHAAARPPGFRPGATKPTSA
jgi:hypothetical protein